MQFPLNAPPPLCERNGKGKPMFIGHYGPAFGAKAAARSIPLWVLFIAVQWLDVVWSILVLNGIEKVKI